MKNKEKQDHISEDKGIGVQQEQKPVGSSVYGAHVSAQTVRKNRKRFKRLSIVGAAFSVFVAIVLLICAATGFLEVSVGNCTLLVILLIVLAAAILMRDWLPAILQRGLKFVRPIIVVCAVPVGLCLVELPSNTAFLSMDLGFLLLNLLILTILFVIIYFIGQRSRIAVLVFLLMCLALGATDYFLIGFKGTPIMPSDLFAISTAFSVAGGYSYDLDGGLVAALAVFLIYCIILALLPKVELTLRRAAVSCGIAVVIAVCSGYLVSTVDLEDAFGFEIDTWDSTGSYAQKGAMVCFVSLAQNLNPHAPKGYSAAEAEKLLDDASAYEPEEYELLANTDDLAVVVVMNETFADLSKFPGLEDSEARPSAFYKVAEDSLESGTTYVSAFAGGTCNSEFEFLTGDSLGFYKGSTYPYTMFDLDGTTNYVEYFSSLGFATHAIHPDPASNWNRENVYEGFGFNDFADETCFEGADTLRDFVTDRATYDYVLDLLNEESGSQFIFDVTIQNHGGYDVGTIPEDEMVSITLPDGTESSELNEYASSIQHSDADLSYFVEQLYSLDRPVLLCFFGDHHPEISTWLYEDTHDGAYVYDSGLDAIEEIQAIPYFIWANASARGIDLDDPEESYRDFSHEGILADADSEDEDIEDFDSEYGDFEDADSEDENIEDVESEHGRIWGAESEHGRIEGAALGIDVLRSNGNGLTEEGDISEQDDADAQDELQGDLEDEESGTFEEDEESETFEEDETDEANLEDKTAIVDGDYYSEEKTNTNHVTSLNFLGAHLVNYTGFPLTNFQKLLLKTNATVSAMNLYGYRLNNGAWYWYDNTTYASPLLDDYAIVEHYNLFG